MSSIFVCPKCSSVSNLKQRCFNGEFCNREHGEERVEYSPISNQVPFSIGDSVFWTNNSTQQNTVECLDVLLQQGRKYSNAATIIDIVDGLVVSALTEDPDIQKVFSLKKEQWCSGNIVLTK